MKYRLLVFDWDGTLMDSEARIVACIQAAARDMGIPEPPRHEAKNIIGLGLHEAVAMLFPQLDGETQVQALADRYRHHFLGAEPTPETLFPSVDETLRGLESAGYFLAVATGKSRRGLDRSLSVTGLGGLFHATRCADETFSKPHPQMLEEVMEVVGVDPQDTLMIGDTEYDMQMARNAGTHAVGVDYGVHEVERLVENGALACFSSIADLPAWLDRRHD